MLRRSAAVLAAACAALIGVLMLAPVAYADDQPVDPVVAQTLDGNLQTSYIVGGYSDGGFGQSVQIPTTTDGSTQTTITGFAIGIGSISPGNLPAVGHATVKIWAGDVPSGDPLTDPVNFSQYTFQKGWNYFPVPKTVLDNGQDYSFTVDVDSLGGAQLYVAIGDDWASPHPGNGLYRNSGETTWYGRGSQDSPLHAYGHPTTSDEQQYTLDQADARLRTDLTSSVQADTGPYDWAYLKMAIAGTSQQDPVLVSPDEATCFQRNLDSVGPDHMVDTGLQSVVDDMRSNVQTATDFTNAMIDDIVEKGLDPFLPEGLTWSNPETWDTDGLANKIFDNYVTDRVTEALHVEDFGLPLAVYDNLSSIEQLIAFSPYFVQACPLS